MKLSSLGSICSSYYVHIAVDDTQLLQVCNSISPIAHENPGKIPAHTQFSCYDSVTRILYLIKRLCANYFDSVPPLIGHCFSKLLLTCVYVETFHIPVGLYLHIYTLGLSKFVLTKVLLILSYYTKLF